MSNLRNIFKVIVLFIIVLKFYSCSFRNSLSGLYGECNIPNWGYMCQQVKFEGDSTFKFYALLHLRGWTASEGNWTIKGDTIILNSKRKPYELRYLDKSPDDSIRLVIKSVPDYDFFVIINTSNHVNKIISYPVEYIWLKKERLDTIIVRSISDFRAKIVLDKEKTIESGAIEITIDESTANQIFFENEKWLKKGNKLFHTQDKAGNFDKNKFFVKAKSTELKYNAEGKTNK